MSFLSENVIPGNHGKVFGTNAEEDLQLQKIKKAIAEIDGIKDVIINKDVFPREITVHTSKVVSINKIEQRVIKLGFHVIPKGLFAL